MYVKIVFCCSVLFYTALVGFVFGVVEGGITGGVADIVMLGFFYCLLTGVKTQR